MDKYIVIALVCALFSYLLVPITIRVAHKVNAISIPHTRHIHKEPIPLFGGLAIFIAFLMGFVIFAKPELFSYNSVAYEIPSILIASILILLLGMIDDINPLSAKEKFVIQLIISLIIIFYGRLRIDNVFTFLPQTLDTILSILLTIFWIVSVINAINLVDGLNGLSAGVSVIYFATVIVLYLFGGYATNFALVISALMLGSTLGYLPWNFPNAKVFMGDAGSMFLGLMISVIPLLGFKQVTLVSLFLPMMMMVIPVYEIFSTVLRRKLKNQSLGEADTDHIHHKLLRATKSPTTVVLIIWSISILFSIDAIILEIGNSKLGIVMFVVLVIVGTYILQILDGENSLMSHFIKLIKRKMGKK